MTSGFVQVPAQSKNLDTNTVTTSEGLVHRQVVNLGDPTGASGYVGLSGDALKVSVSNNLTITSSALPTGAATESTLGAINDKLTVGQDVEANSLSVVLASDQPAIAVNLPTGAATEAKQDTGNTSLSSIDSKTAALVSGRVPVDPSGVTSPVSAASLPLPTGASTLAEQQTQTTELIEVNTKLNNDIFGRLRVSNPETIFDLTHLYDKQAVFVNELTENGATSTHLPNESSVQMNVTNTAGSRIVRQTRRYFNYQPAKSFLIFLTVVLSTTVNSGITSRIGLFDNHADKTVDTGGNGFFFQYSGGVVSVVKRSYITGSQVDTVVNQSAWNGDKLDGTGASGLTFDVTKAQIFWINAQWLGVGSVKMGVVIDGVFITVHTFTHANIINSVYSSRISLPIRYELIRDSAAGVSKMICSSVISEGGYTPQGRSFSRAMNTSFNVNSETVMMAFRLKNAYNRATIIPKFVEILETSSDSLLYRVYVGCTLTGASWVDNNTGVSAVEYDESSTAISGGRVVASGYISTTNRGASTFVESIEGVATEINGTQDIIAITVESLSGAATASAAFTWSEIV